MYKFKQKSYSVDILNTRGVDGFDRNRNYDQHLNPMELSKNIKTELRKTRDLNLNKELGKLKLDARKEFKGNQLNNELRDITMGKVVLKRKTYGVIGETGRGILNGVGKAADSKIGRLAGAIGGYKFLGSALGTLLGVGPILGGIGGAVLGSKLTGGLGKGLQNASYNI